MTPETVQYSLQGQIATIRIDDGKRNASLRQCCDIGSTPLPSSGR